MSDSDFQGTEHDPSCAINDYFISYDNLIDRYGMTSHTLGQKYFAPLKPERGVFPLDHEGECKELMLKYMLCLSRSDNKPSQCQVESKDYFQCRMDRKLMKKHEWEDLGYFDEKKPQT